jgi:crotonobetainyl-CoA:carnitine CoA-transferase CaiB-like acyl-CoA transferase
MSRAFEGIRVIDTTHVIAGPFATYQLALLGADVIKIEHPTEPDQTRRSGSDPDLNANEMGTQYVNQGANKRSITLDLKTEKGREILKRLVADADVFVENYRSEAFPALGLGYEDLKKINPALIYCSLTAWGDKGPRSNQTAYDQVIQAYSGVMSITGTPETGPLRCGPQLLDFGGGIIGALAISSALFRRAQTGQGQHVTPTLTDTAFQLMSAQITASLRSGKELTFQTTDRKHAGQSCYVAKDGEQIMLGAFNDQQYARFWTLVGEPERGAASLAERYDRAADDRARIAAIMLTKTAQEWEDCLQQNHIAAARLRTVQEALDDPQTEYRNARHWFEDGDCPGVEGRLSVPVAGFGADVDGPRVDTPPPRYGADTDDVLAEIGMSADEIAEARAQGVI